MVQFRVHLNQSGLKDPKTPNGHFIQVQISKIPLNAYTIGLYSAPITSKAAYLVAVVHAITPTQSNRSTWWPWCMQIPLNDPTLSNRPELCA